MKGIVIHHKNGIKRAIEGKSTQGRLSMRPVLAVGSPEPEKISRPVAFIFYEDKRVIAKSSRVFLTNGRRYPNVEHWFVLREGPWQSAPTDVTYDSAAL